MGQSVSQDETAKPFPSKHQDQKEQLPPSSKIIETKEEKQKLPHNYENIIKDSDSPIDYNNLLDQLRSGVFLNQKRKKYWIDDSGTNCFMLFPKDLSITWGDDKRYWHWPYLKDSTSDVLVDVAELLNVCFLEVHGEFDSLNLSPGVTYEVVFEVMLKDPAYGWEDPVNLRLVFSDGETQEHKENLMSKIRGQWIELPVGQVQTSNKIGQMQFSLFEYHGGKWKRGLVIKGVSIRPRK